MLLPQPHTLIKTEEDLRTRISRPIALIAEKKAPTLNENDERFIAQSPFICITTRGTDGAVTVSAHSGKPGFAYVFSEKVLVIPLSVDQPLREDQQDSFTSSECGLIFLIPGINDTLRVNGQGTLINTRKQLGTFFPKNELPSSALLVDITESYVQCPKALLRAHIWNPQIASSSLAQLKATPKPLTAFDANCRLFLEHATFLCLGTSNGQGEADISPRGDPPGAFKVLDDRVLLIGDRPGNRLVDSHHNVLQYPSVGLIFFIPGLHLTLTVRGKVSLTTDQDLLELLTVQEKKPLLAVWIDIESVFLSHSQALERSNIWKREAYTDPKTLPGLAERGMDFLKLLLKKRFKK
jgi:PPOX class probable FMN-dependent enzyme